MPIFEIAPLPPSADPFSQAEEYAAPPALKQPMGRPHNSPTDCESEAQARIRGAERVERWEAARDRLRGCANKPPALSEEFRARLDELNDLRHIRRTTGCFQVEIWRGKSRFRKGFAGFSPKSLEAAMHARDEALALLPSRRLYLVPEEVLRASGIATPIPGITRFPARSVYRVDYVRADGKTGTKLFYFRHVPEADAYAAAVAFTNEVFADKESGRQPCHSLRMGRDPLMCEALTRLRNEKRFANTESPVLTDGQRTS